MKARTAARRPPGAGHERVDHRTLAAELGPRVAAWFRHARRRLPWREDPTPYRVWVSEVMLQQTRVETVIPYYQRFVERYPSVKDLAMASLDEVLALWSGLGYYRRAHSLHAGSRAVLERHGGEFPRDMDSALEVPGVGPYTAAAILSIAYGILVPVIDGNVERVLTRLLRLRGDPRAAPASRELESFALRALPGRDAGDHNQALMELGAMVCKPLRPDCPACPLEDLCLSREHGDPERFPEKRPERATVAVSLHAAIVRSGQAYLLELSREGGLLQGLWLFPTIERRVTPRRRLGPVRPGTLIRSLEEKLGIPFRSRGHACTVRHSITHRRLSIDAFILEPEQPIEVPAPDGAGAPAFRWAFPGEMGRTIPVSSIALKIVSAMERRGAGTRSVRPFTNPAASPRKGGA